MLIRPSSALRHDYSAISELTKTSGEPVFITHEGKADGVFMSREAYEERESLFRHRDELNAAELSRMSGDPVFTASQVHEKLEALLQISD